MEIVGLIVFAAALLLAAYAYYALASIAYAIWYPDKSKVKWVKLAESPAVQLFFPWFKWLFPVALAIIFVSLVFSVLAVIARAVLF